MSSERKQPNPGSAEARAAHCHCPVIDNGHGKGSGFVDEHGDPTFWISEDCPLHGIDMADEEDPENHGQVEAF